MPPGRPRDNRLFPHRSRRHKVGLPPGAVVFVGEQRTAPTTYGAITYGSDRHTPLTPETAAEAVDAFLNTPDDAVTWLDVKGVHETSVVQHIGDCLDLPALLQEDIVNTGQRPKIDDAPDALYISAKMLMVDESTLNAPQATASSATIAGSGAPSGPAERQGDARQQGDAGRRVGVDDAHDRSHAYSPLTFEQISLVVREEGVISFQEHPDDVFDPIRQRIASGRGRIRAQGPGYLAYAILDVIVDHYFVVLEHLAARAEVLEDRILEDPDDDVQHALNMLRRDLIAIRRHAWPMREVMSRLERSNHPLWPDDLRPFVRDAYEHSVQVIDMVESLRDLTGGLTDLYMTTLSNRMNEIMKVLTIIGTIFIPLTFVAGIYGMNFERMPELSAPYGYPVALIAMTAIAGMLLVYFRKKGWL